MGFNRLNPGAKKMKWKAKPPKDPYRWQSKFAWTPRQIGDHWIWLEKYQWRPEVFDDYGLLYWEYYHPKIGHVTRNSGIYGP